MVMMMMMMMQEKEMYFFSSSAQFVHVYHALSYDHKWMVCIYMANNNIRSNAVQIRQSLITIYFIWATNSKWHINKVSGQKQVQESWTF